MAAHDVQATTTQQPVVQLVNRLLLDAVNAGASDVHFEAQEQGLRVRYRIDGVLQEVPSPPASAARGGSPCGPRGSTGRSTRR